jgi:hypothetical protein
MKKFLAIYLGTPGGFEKWMAVEEAKRKALEAKGMQAWGQWMQTHAKSVIDAGGPLGKTKRIAAGGVTDTKNQMTGYGVFGAETHEAVAKLFIGHPHFTIFPGECVEVMEILPIPGQA